MGRNVPVWHNICPKLIWEFYWYIYSDFLGYFKEKLYFSVYLRNYHNLPPFFNIFFCTFRKSAFTPIMHQTTSEIMGRNVPVSHNIWPKLIRELYWCIYSNFLGILRKCCILVYTFKIITKICRIFLTHFLDI